MTETGNTTVLEVGLVERDGEPRAKDLDIAERLGFDRPRNIRNLIERNKSELESFGPLALHSEAQRRKNGGTHEIAEYWLNEEQSLLVAALSKAPRAAEVRSMLIKVFVAYRRGHLPAVDQQALARQIAAIVDGKLERTVRRLKDAHTVPTFDMTATVTAIEIIETAGIGAKERVRGTSNMVTHAMLDFCGGAGCLRTPETYNKSRPWRFPRDKAHEWLFGERLGAEAIRNQIARQRKRRLSTGQAALRLVPAEVRP